jgi:hypothetical protein
VGLHLNRGLLVSWKLDKYFVALIIFISVPMGVHI